MVQLTPPVSQEPSKQGQPSHSVLKHIFLRPQTTENKPAARFPQSRPLNIFFKACGLNHLLCTQHPVPPTVLHTQRKIMVAALFWAHPVCQFPAYEEASTDSMDQRPTPFYCGLNTHLHKNVVFQWVSWCALEAIPSWTAALTKSRGLRPCQVHAVREQVHRASLVESLSARWLPTPNHRNLDVFQAQISAAFCRASFSLSWYCTGWEMSISTGVTSRDYSRDLQLSPGKDKKFLCCEFQMTSLIKNFPLQDM